MTVAQAASQLVEGVIGRSDSGIIKKFVSSMIYDIDTHDFTIILYIVV